METPHMIPDPKPPLRLWRIIKRLLGLLLFSGFAIISFSVVLLYLYEDEVKKIMITELNKHLNAEIRIQPKDIDLTLLHSFPNCALEFKNITVMEATKNKEKDTLLFAEQLLLAFNVKDLFHKNYHINTIALQEAKAFLKVDRKGNPNYIVWKTDTSSISNDSLSFALEQINLKNISLHYKNHKQKIKIETHIKQLQFSGKFNHANYLLKTNGSMAVQEFQIEKKHYLRHKNLVVDIALDVNKNKYTIKHSEISINAAQLESNGSFIINDSLTSLDIYFNGNNLDICTSLSLLPEKFQTPLNDYKSDGEFYARGNVHYKNGHTITVNTEFGIKHATITYKPQQTTLTNVNLVGSIDMNEHESVLKLNHIKANLNNNTLSGNLEVSNFKNPYLTLNISANTKLEELISFYPIDTLQEASGNILVNAKIEGLISEMASNAYSPTIKANGEITLTNLKVKFKQSEKELNIPEGQLKLNNRRLNVFGLTFIKGQSDVLLVGEMPNFLGYLFDSQTPLVVNASVSSEFINVEDFLFPTHASSSEHSTVSVSDKLDLNVDLNIKQLVFGKFSAQHVKGAFLLKQQKMALSNVALNTADGSIKLNVFADASAHDIKVSGDGELSQLNIQKLFSQLNNFGQTTLQDKHLKGFLTANVNFMATWNNQLQVDVKSIKAQSNLLIERGELHHFEPLDNLAKYIDVNELKHIQFSTLQSTIDIKDNVVSIPKTSIKSSAINLELWGKHYFDNRIDYHIQLLWSDFLAKRPRANKRLDEEFSPIERDAENRRSIFILMTGLMDNPTIKWDKKGAREKIREDIRQEKQTIKQLLKEEFQLFKKDTIHVKKAETSNQPFQVKFEEEKPLPSTGKMPQPKQKDEDEDF